MIIKAGSVTNLTDARFFAAADVNYIGFCFDPQSPNYISPQNALAIKGWISGPKFVAEFNNQDVDNVRNIISFLDPDVIELTDQYFEGAKEIDWNLPVIRRTLITNLISVKKYDYLFVLIEGFSGINFPDAAFPLMFDISGIDSELINPAFNAIEIRLGHEDEIGVRDYDEVNEILQMLADFSKQ